MLMGERRVAGYTPLDEVSHSYRGWCAHNIGHSTKVIVYSIILQGGGVLIKGQGTHGYCNIT